MASVINAETCKGRESAATAGAGPPEEAMAEAGPVNANCKGFLSADRCVLELILSSKLWCLAIHMAVLHGMLASFVLNELFNMQFCYCLDAKKYILLCNRIKPKSKP